MKKTFSIVGFFFFFLSTLSAQLPPGFVQQVLVENIDPVSMAMLPDGRILIAEKKGAIRLVKEGKLEQSPLLLLKVDIYNERGLQSIVIEPDFEHHPYVYVFYTTQKGFNRVARFTINGDLAIPQSEISIIDMDPLEASIHNGGALAFGPDGKIYVATGDTGTSSNSVNLTNLHGKILRLNKDGSIPEDNPFYGELSGKNRAIYAYGFRNPFSMAVDPISGDIIANDVGGSMYEEVNKIVGGKDYGWPVIEGYKSSSQIVADNYIDPLYAYTHQSGRCAIVGAAYYQPKLKTFPPEYWNRFFFGDYCSGEILYLNPETGIVEGTLATGVNQLVSIIVNEEGDLFYLQRSGIGGGSVEDNTSSNNGSLVVVRYTGSGAPFISKQPQSITVPAGEDAVFTVFASGEKPLRYEWRLNNLNVGGDSSKLVLNNVDLNLNGAKISCTITNNEGSVVSEPALLYVVEGQRPQPLITSPNEDFLYKGGDTIHFQGIVQDDEDGTLTGASLSWRIDFHHNAHIHPALEAYQGDAGSYLIPQLGETSANVWYRIHLTATDSDGLTNSSYVDVHPLKSTVSVHTVPDNLRLTLDGKSFQRDTSFTSVSGLIRSLHADKLVSKEDKLYKFDSWGSDELNTIYSFSVPQSDTLIKAYFSEVAVGKGDGLTSYFYSNDLKFGEHLPDITIKGNIDYDWKDEAPEGLPADYFYARFIGYVEPYISGEHIFYTNSDDGVRLWVDDQLLIDDWNLHPSGQYVRGSIDLQEGKKYSIKLEYLEAAGLASVQLLWSFANLTKKVIPVTRLYTSPTQGEEGGTDEEGGTGEEYTSGELRGLDAVSEIGLKVYPNPFSGGFNIEVPQDLNWKRMEIQNLEGHSVFSLNKGNITHYFVSNEALPPGLYILKLTTDKKVYQVKLIKRN